MKNKKFNKMIVRCICLVVVLSIFGLFMVNYAVNRVIDSFAAGVPNNQTLVESGDQPPTPSESTEAKQEKGNDSLGKPTGTVTKEKAKEVREKLTVSDKTTVVSVIIKSLSVSDMKKLQDIAKGGLTVEEKREAKELLLAQLSSDDYNELSALAKKYGISRGNTYDEAKREHNS
ncbi:hypothetical protein [Cohnella sp.]|uniref:hypothetical protein n=1 Tax=Cohnella sp. TaxID=1883426 RepID=UPI00356B45D5